MNAPCQPRPVHYRVLSFVGYLTSLALLGLALWLLVYLVRWAADETARREKVIEYSLWMVGSAGQKLFYNDMQYICQKSHCFLLVLEDQRVCIMDLNKPVAFRMKPRVLVSGPVDGRCSTCVSCEIFEFTALFDLIAVIIVLIYMAALVAKLTYKIKINE